MSLTEKVEDAYIRVVGNRVTAAAVVSTLAIDYATYEAVSYFWDKNPLFAVLSVAGGIVGTLFSASYVVDTKCGERTLYFFRRTEKQIKKFDDRLMPRAIELWMAKKTENQALYGYCQQQGMYLAAKKHGHLGAFYKAKRRVSQVRIPHF